MHYGKSTPSIVSEKKWDTKKDKGKSMMHILYVHTVVCQNAPVTYALVKTGR